MGAFRGLAPTGRAIALKGIAIYRVEGGKLMERWVVSDMHVMACLRKSEDPRHPRCAMEQSPNHALQRTAASGRGCNRRSSRPPSLSLGRWERAPTVDAGGRGAEMNILEEAKYVLVSRF